MGDGQLGGEGARCVVRSFQTEPADAIFNAERLHAFLLAHLPLDLQLLLPSPTTDDLANLLPCLSCANPLRSTHPLISRRDGYILIQAFNSALAFSSKAWGFIPDEDVHRTVTAVGEEGKEWTFRRIENLTCWAA